MVRPEPDRRTNAGRGPLGCRRPGCNEPAQTVVSYAAARCEIMIDVIGERSGAVVDGATQPLCEHHADRVVAPHGWVVVDRRSDESLRGVAAHQQPSRGADADNRWPQRRWGGFSSMLASRDRARAAKPVFMTDEFAEQMRRQVSAEAEPAFGSEAATGVDTTPAVDNAQQVQPPVSEPPVVQPPSAAEDHHLGDRSLDAGSEAEPQRAPAQPVAERPVVPRRTEESAEDEPQLLKPKGRMLSKAFGASGHQRTVLSEPLGQGPARRTPPQQGPTHDVGRSADQASTMPSAADPYNPDANS